MAEVNLSSVTQQGSGLDGAVRAVDYDPDEEASCRFVRYGCQIERTRKPKQRPGCGRQRVCATPNLRNEPDGFTLIEVIVVLAVTGLYISVRWGLNRVSDQLRAVLPAMLAVIAGCTSPQASSETDRGPVIYLGGGTTADPEFELGEIDQATAVRFAVGLSNRNSNPIAVARVESSCPCVEFRHSTETIGSGLTQWAELSIDMAKEPGFFGDLAVKLDGYDGQGNRLFAATGFLSVRRTANAERAEVVPVPMPMGAADATTASP